MMPSNRHIAISDLFIRVLCRSSVVKFSACPRQREPPITDSPWFWVLVFSVVALIALGAISGQYGKRQARLERQYQARERVRGASEMRDRRSRSGGNMQRPTTRWYPSGRWRFCSSACIVLAAVMLRRELAKAPHELSG